MRLALVSLSGISYFVQSELQKLIDAIRDKETQPRLEMKAEFAWGTIERMFTAIKTPIDKWLGPGDTPGTPENKARMAMGRNIFKAATGEDL